MRLGEAEFQAMNGAFWRFLHRRVEFPLLVRLGLGESTGRDVVELGCGNGMFGILHHVEAWRRALDECRRLLRPGDGAGQGRAVDGEAAPSARRLRLVPREEARRSEPEPAPGLRAPRCSAVGRSRQWLPRAISRTWSEPGRGTELAPDEPALLADRSWGSDVQKQRNPIEEKAK
jgi:hypothetical protein